MHSQLRQALVLAGLATLGLGRVFADDRNLLYTQQASPANILVMISNTTTMENKPATTVIDPLGGVDGANSKMGIAKSALGAAVKANPSFRWGLSSYSYDRADLTSGSKHFVFESSSDDFKSGGNLQAYGRAAHTKINVGKGYGAIVGVNKNKCSGSLPSITTPCWVTYGTTNYGVVKWQAAATATDGSIYDPATAPTSDADTTNLPYFGRDGSTVMLIIGVGGDSQKQEVFKIDSASLTTNPYAITTSQSFTVDETVYTCQGGASAPCDVTANASVVKQTDPNGSNPTQISYVIPSTFCREDSSSCGFPQIFGYGADAGREIGWSSSPNADSSWLDWNGNNSSGNASGWLNHSSVNPQPIVMIPRDWNSWVSCDSTKGTCNNQFSIKGSATAMTYVQNTTATPCFNRAFRPTASILHVSSGAPSSTYTARDDFPIWAAATQTTTIGGSSVTGYDQNSACDTNLDGYVQNKNDLASGGNNVLISPVFVTKNGNVAPLQGALTDVFQYYNGGNTAGSCNKYVDTFCGGVRADDPNQNCRHDYVILITDSFVQQSSITKSDVTKFTQVGNGGIKVFVIGFGINSAGGDVGSTTYCTFPDSTYGYTGGTGNAGMCIAWWTGATQFDSTTNKVVGNGGYYTANDSASLAAAFASILASLNETNRDFATATIPSVSTVSEGVAYLSEFNPKSNRSIWSGHLRAFALNSSGLIQTTTNADTTDSTLVGTPLLTQYSFGDATTAPTGSFIWEAGAGSTSPVLLKGNLDSNTNSSQHNPEGVDPTQYLVTLTDGTVGTPNRGGAWSTPDHDQAIGSGVRPGRNVFFALKPGQKDASNTTICASSTYECMVQMPVGTGGTSAYPETASGFTPPSRPSTIPNWWNTVRDSCLYARIPSVSMDTPCTTLGPSTVPESGSSRDQALQNSFSFIRGNRDPVVESLKLATPPFSATDTLCSSANVSGATDASGQNISPCYGGDVLGDIFHSNPVVVSFPNNGTYFFAQDPGASDIGTYADRDGKDETGATCTKPCKSYDTFFTSYAHRRKVLYVGANDALFHAFDVGVYNGDQSDALVGGSVTKPFLNKYDFGSGREIFAYAPRAGLNKIYQLAHTTSPDWTVDGPPANDDVYIDTSNVSGTPRGVNSSGAGSDISGTNPQWRTVVIGLEREGGTPGSVGIGGNAGGGIQNGVSGTGGSIFALDVTDPDQPAHMAQSDTGGHRGVPECLVGDFVPGASKPTGCTSSEYPKILWEIRDDQSASSTSLSPAEKTGTNEATTQDLGFTWSRPVMGRIKVHDTVASADRDYFVAIFGGGFDHAGTDIASTNTSGNTANFLYMADIETGKIIYKRNLGLWNSGASGTNTTGGLAAGVPGEPGVADLNNDGYLDRVYVGDTQGRIWKVDLTVKPNITSGLIDVNAWIPTLFFDEYQTASPSGGAIRQPIFNRPTLFLAGTTSAGLPRVAIAVGTGDRDNMPILTDNSHPNLFIAAVDDPTFTYPIFLSSLTLASESSNLCSGVNGCFNGTGKGFYISLPTGTDGVEIVNTNALVFENTITFNTFLRAQLIDSNTGAAVCGQKGEAFFHHINATTGVSLLTDSSGNLISEKSAGSEVASDPIVYQAQSIWIVSATDNTKVPTVAGGNPPAARVKTWKEQ